MDKAYLDPFLHRKTLRWCEPYNGGMSLKDTGLCNRLLHWEVAYEINKLNDFKFKILLEDCHWKELKYLKLPNTLPVRDTYFSNKKVLDLKFKSVYDYDNQTVYLAEPLLTKDMKKMVKSKNFTLDKDNYYADFGYDFIEEVKGPGKRGLELIQFKHKDFEKIIKNQVKGCIGLHIRRGEGITVTLDHINQLPKEIQHFFDSQKGDPKYKWISDPQYFNVIDGILKKHPQVRFYLSTDMLEDQYSYLIQRYKGRFVTRKEVYNKVFHLANYFESVDDWQLGAFVNIIDLFALGSCEFIIKAPGSTWSDVAAIWRKTPSIDIDQDSKVIIKKVNNYFDGKRNLKELI